MENHRVPPVFAVVFVAAALTLGADVVETPKGVFASLKVGQVVSLKDEGSNFTISFFTEEVPLPYQVIEIGNDFIVLRDVADVEKTIPVYSIKAITKVRMGSER